MPIHDDMTAPVAIRHQSRVAVEPRLRRGSQLAASARLPRPVLAHVRRTRGELGPGTPVVLVEQTTHPLAVVARLWFGVLAVFTLIVVVGLAAFVLVAWALGFRPVVVTSGSMAPLVRTGDIVITRSVDPDTALGDQTVVDFDDPATEERRLHRIVEVTDAGYRTKGDANATADPQVVSPERIHGAGLVLAPYIGYLPLWMQERAWPQLAAAAATLLALAVMSRRAWMWRSETA